ncbi:hypothetical protein P879_07632 [Paragonimus westermani]|uniref:Uncharacterized protein n=1 Tax=Paragonimus westermani TaxID=34504 RepID=A0A8T0D324_9TREM|nr:hypothetical protein P879_07632 [Paragonimus westermani]
MSVSSTTHNSSSSNQLMVISRVNRQESSS